MARLYSIKAVVTLLLIGLSTTLCNAADQKVGKIVQLRGSTNIERDKKQIPAAVRGEILSSDIITTGSSSRAKLLFIDDSVLTMSDNSKLVVKEFIYSKGEQGKSVFNLLDGKMRSVVGKTKFEVHTPTAVAAARGTVIYFDVGMVNNQRYSKIICLEGNVQIRNIVPTVTGQVTLKPGTMVVVKANEPPPPPITAPPAELNKAKQSTGNGGSGSSGNGSSGSGDSSASGGGSSTTGGDSSSTGGTGTSGSAGSTGGTGSTGSTGGTGGGEIIVTPVPQPQPLPPPTFIQPPIIIQPIVQPSKVRINIGLP